MFMILPQTRLFQPDLPAKLVAERFIGNVGLIMEMIVALCRMLWRKIEIKEGIISGLDGGS
jgi:hypothetical protein